MCEFACVRPKKPGNRAARSVFQCGRRQHVCCNHIHSFPSFCSFTRCVHTYIRSLSSDDCIVPITLYMYSGGKSRFSQLKVKVSRLQIKKHTARLPTKRVNCVNKSTWIDKIKRAREMLQVFHWINLDIVRTSDAVCSVFSITINVCIFFASHGPMLSNFCNQNSIFFVSRFLFHARNQKITFTYNVTESHMFASYETNINS